MTDPRVGPVGITDLEPHRRELTGYCQRMVGMAEADDAVQETLFRAWRAAGRFDGRSSLRVWLYRIAANTCLDLLRGRERRSRLGERLLATAEPAATPDPAELVATQDSVRLALAAVLDQLPARQRAALILCEIFRWPSDEAAELLGTSVAAITSSRQRARATLARQSGLDGRGAVDTGQLARYQDAFQRYDIATLVRIIQTDAGITVRYDHSSGFVGVEAHERTARQRHRHDHAECRQDL